MEIFLQVILSGAAVAYFTEFITVVSPSNFSGRVIKLVLTAPLSYYACWLFGIVGFPLIVSGLAAAFFATSVMALLDKATTVINTVNRR